MNNECSDNKCLDNECSDCPDNECPDNECPDNERPDDECPDNQCPDDQFHCLNCSTVNLYVCLCNMLCDLNGKSLRSSLTQEIEWKTFRL